MLATDRTALAFLALLLVLALEPIVLRGHVAVPHDNARELAAERAEAGAPEIRRFSDISRYFVPALEHHFHGDHTGWLATWNPHVQLGKPSSQHVGGYTKAYPPTYLLSFFTRDPYRLHAWLSVAIATLLALFSYLLLRALGLHPAACLLGAAGIGLNARTTVLFGFAEFLATTAWSVGLMWLCLAFVRRRSLTGWLGIVFVAYCLLTGSRHQAAIGAAYFVIPFVLLSLYRHADTWPARARTGLVLLAAAALAALLAFPLLHDLVQAGLASTRLVEDRMEFLRRDTGAKSATDLFLAQLSVLWNPWLFGNPGRPEYPLATPALNLTPFSFALLVVAFVTGAARRAWLFAAVLALFLCIALFPGAHVFAIRHLGFGFARWNPVGALLVPIGVLVAYAADALLADPERRRIRTAPPLLLALAATGAALVLIAARSALELDGWSVLLSAVLVLAAGAFLVWRTAGVVYLAVALSVLAFTKPALLHRPVEDVLRTSPLVERLRAATADGSRYAKLGWLRVGQVLPSNMEVLVGLRSIHSYDSLSSRRYDTLAKQLSEGGTHVLGRQFDALDSAEALRSPRFPFTGVGAVVSDRPIPLPGWSGEQIRPHLWLYAAARRPTLAARIADYTETPEAGVVLDDAAALRAGRDGLEETERHDDLRRFRMASLDTDTLLFLSMQYHADWVARASGERLRTVPVNGFYLGVVVPPGVREVTLRFEPMARWAWIPLAFFALCLAGLGGHRLARAAHRPRRASGRPAVRSAGTLRLR